MDRKKLRGRIVEVYETQGEFAKALGVYESTVSKLLREKSEFSRSEIERWCELLKIPPEKIPEYFFTD